MKKEMKNWLRSSIVLALAAGALVGGSSVQAANTYDMTQGEFLTNGLNYTTTNTYQDKDTLIYKWDAKNKKIIGGNVSVGQDVLNSSYEGVNVNLVIDASDLSSMSNDDVKEAMTQLASKIKNYAETNRYRLNAYVQVREGLTASSKVLRSYHLEYKTPGWDDPDQEIKPDANVGDLEEGVFATPIINGTAGSEYEFDENGVWRYKGFSGEVDVNFTTPATDNVYAAIRTDGKDTGISNLTENSSFNSTLQMNADASSLADSKAYLAYSGTGNQVSVIANELNATVKGTEATGIYAGHENGDTTSKVVVNGGINLTLDGKKTTGVEAGKNGEVSLLTGQKAYNRTNTVSIESPNGHAVYAHDGGKVTLDAVKVKKADKSAICAEKGGNITLGIVSGLTDESISTDDDAGSQVSLSVDGNYTGQVKGNVNVAFTKGSTYKADNDSIGTVTLNGSTWDGSLLRDNGSVSINSNGQWNMGETGRGIKLSALTGGKTTASRGYVKMGSDNLHIGTYSGNGTFIYNHDASDPTKILGGNITIEESKPLSLSSTDLGDKGDSTAEGTSASTIAIATDSAGIDTTDNALVEKVLDNLASKLAYLNYTKGERNLSGTVELLEGLTSSSVTKHFANLTFDEKTGQAKRDSEVYHPYVTYITGDASIDTAYADAYNADTNTYDFNQDVFIREAKSTDSVYSGSLYYGLITNYGTEYEKPSKGFGMWKSAKPDDGPSYTIDLHGNNLTVDLEAFPEAKTTGSQPMWTTAAIMAAREGTIKITNPGEVHLTCNANYYYGSAIRASTSAGTTNGAHVVIENDQGNLKDHIVYLRGGIDTPGYQLNYRTIETYGNNKAKDITQENSVYIKGLVDIEADKHAAVFARGGWIRLGGGRISVDNYDALWTVGKGRIDINMLVDDDGTVKGAGSNDFVLKGNAVTATPYYGKNGTLNLAFTTANSRFDGETGGTGEQNLYVQNGAVWNNTPESYNIWSSGEVVKSDLASIATHLYGGQDAAHTGYLIQDSAKDLTIKNYSGFMKAYIARDESKSAGEDGTDATSQFSQKGNIIIEKADQTDGQNADFTLLTSQEGIDTSNKEEVLSVMKDLAGKLIYKEATDSENPAVHLNGHVGLAEGLIAGSVETRLADLTFDGTSDGTGSVVDSTYQIPKNYPAILYGPKETAMMRGAKSAMASTAMIWRAINNDVERRLGDLRVGNAEKENGMWAKVGAGRMSYDEGTTDFRTRFNEYHIGYDHAVGNAGWRAGASVSYIDGKSTYEKGTGDNDVTNFHVYATKTMQNGAYLDIIGRVSHAKNKYHIMNDAGNKLDGDYGTNGYGLSAEYGKRFVKDSGFYVEPQAELTWGRLSGKSYDAASDYGGGRALHVDQDDFNSLIGRIGVGFGLVKERSSIYAKLSLLHEFQGGFDTQYTAKGEPSNATHMDFDGTWVSAMFGGTYQLGDRANFYGYLEKTYGGDLKTDWRYNVGLRFTF